MKEFANNAHHIAKAIAIWKIMLSYVNVIIPRRYLTQYAKNASQNVKMDNEEILILNSVLTASHHALNAKMELLKHVHLAQIYQCYLLREIAYAYFPTR